MSGQSAEIDEVSALIDPWPFWADEDEDDEGNAVPNSLSLYLTSVVSPVDGSRWVTSIHGPRIMLRRDVVDLETRPPTSWGFEHSPEAFNALTAPPCAVPTKAKFDPDLVAPLLDVPRVRVLPLTDDEVAKPMAHAVMRGEDLIGFVMSTAKGGKPLPEEILVPDRRSVYRPGQAAS